MAVAGLWCIVTSFPVVIPTRQTQGGFGTTLALTHPGAPMRLALPEHKGRIAPVFDCCKRLLVVDRRSDRDIVLQSQDWSTLARAARPSGLRELRIHTLLCGGISCCMEGMVCRQDIKVIPWLSGDIKDILNAFRNQRIEDPRFMMPGRARCRRRRRGFKPRSAM